MGLAGPNYRKLTGVMSLEGIGGALSPKPEALTWLLASCWRPMSPPTRSSAAGHASLRFRV